MTEASSNGRDLFGAGSRVSRLLGRLGLTMNPNDANQWTAVVLVAVVVVPPFALSAISGALVGGNVDLPFLSDVDSLVRLVVVVPVLVLASVAIGLQLGLALSYLEQTDFVSDADRSQYENSASTLKRRVSAPRYIVAVVAVAITVTVLLYLSVAAAEITQSSWVYDRSGGGGFTAAGWWYAFVSRPVVTFLLLLWAWRYVAWSLFLRDLARLDLNILPGHPDLTGGLLPIGRGHSAFVLVGFAVNAVLAGAIANDLLHGDSTIATIRPEVLFFTAVSLLVLLAPLTAFVPSLLKAKNAGLVQYGHAGHDLTLEFETRWGAGGEGMLHTADPSAVADFGADYDVVQLMRPFPLGLRQVIVMGVILFVPFSALILTQVSPIELAKALMGRLL